MSRAFGRILLVGSFLLAGCGDVTAPVVEVPASVVVTLSDVDLPSIGQEVVADAVILDAADRELEGFRIIWEVEDENVLEPVGAGVFRSVGTGSTRIVARVADAEPGVDPGAYDSGRRPSGETEVVVDQRPARIIVSPDTTVLWALSQERQLTARVVDALGTPMIQEPGIQWSVEDDGVVAVDPTGLTQAQADGATTVFASVESLRGRAEVRVSSAISYQACFSFSTADGEVGEEECAAVAITARARGDS